MLSCRVSSLRRRFRPSHAAWLVYVATALACTAYLNGRAELVPKWGHWYAPDDPPTVLLQVRALVAGKLAVLDHPSGGGHDFDWGRGGIHSNFGLGLPILSLPLHLLGRLSGAPGFPDGVELLIFYAMTTVVLARVLHRASASSATSASVAAGFVMVFPAFVGLASSEFQVYEQTIEAGALFGVLLLCGVLAVLYRSTPGRLVAVCAAAGFAVMIRPTLALYGVTTLGLALVVARRGGMRARWMAAGVAAYAAMMAVYLATNWLRFGGPLHTGYANITSDATVNRLTRWGTSFARVPLLVAAKELYWTMFRLPTITSDALRWGPPPALRSMVRGDRWREYYSPTYDLFTLAIWVGALVSVCFLVVRRRLWRADRPLRGEVALVVGAWSIPTALGLFVFYLRLPNMVTRYLVDFYPAFAAAALCVGMVILQVVRDRLPTAAPRAELAIAGCVALYIGGWRGWMTHMSVPVERATVLARIAAAEARSAEMPPVQSTFTCHEPRGPDPVPGQWRDWHDDCSFGSGTYFAMPHTACVTFAFAPSGERWTAHDEASLDGFRANADFDPLVSCGPAKAEEDLRMLTMCEPAPPPFLVDGLRLYSIASLAKDLEPIDRLKLLRVSPAAACPPRAYEPPSAALRPPTASRPTR